jgi:cobalt transport protein ATP-binding subunit
MIAEMHEPIPTLSPSAAVALRAVSFRYPDGQQALRQVTLDVAHGEKVALVGPNGAGKSTLLLHLNGVLGALDGSVQISGLDVRRATLPRVRALVGLVFQDPDDQLFSPTVFDDVAFGPLHMDLPTAEVRRRVGWALEQVGMRGFEERVPHHLSLGQRKRVAVATVLSMEPVVLALDEPSAGLDPRARNGLIRLLQSLSQTLLISTHDLPLVADVCTRAVVLNAGTIAYDGPSGQLLGDAELLAEYGLV